VETRAAMRQLWAELKQTVEPSSETVFAALLQRRGQFRGLHVGLVLTGGNVDLDAIDLKLSAKRRPARHPGNVSLDSR